MTMNCCARSGCRGRPAWAGFPAVACRAAAPCSGGDHRSLRGRSEQSRGRSEPGDDQPEGRRRSERRHRRRWAGRDPAPLAARTGERAEDGRARRPAAERKARRRSSLLGAPKRGRDQAQEQHQREHDDRLSGKNRRRQEIRRRSPNRRSAGRAATAAPRDPPRHAVTPARASLPPVAWRRSSVAIAGMTSTAPNPSMNDHPISSTPRLGLSAVIREPAP